jgi:hypothetical protein
MPVWEEESGATRGGEEDGVHGPGAHVRPGVRPPPALRPLLPGEVPPGGVLAEVHGTGSGELPVRGGDAHRPVPRGQ